MKPRIRHILCVLVALWVTAAPAHAFLSWYFQFDPKRIAAQAKIYAEQLNKNNQTQKDLKKAEGRRDETKAMEKEYGKATKGNIDTKNDALDAAIAKNIATEKLIRENRDKNDEKTGYDVYLDQVQSWRTNMEAYRLKADALAKEANSRPLTLLEWQSMQTQYRLVLGQMAAAEASAANDRAEIQAAMMQRRTVLREELARVKQQRQD